MSGENTISTFAYDDSEQRIVVEQRFTEAQTLMRQGLSNMIEAGGKFAQIRDLLRHNKQGGFERWIETKQMESRTVYRLMDLHRAFGTLPQMSKLDIPATAAFLLAAPSVPDEARAEALQYAEAGERITVAKAQAIVNQYRPPEPPATPDDLKAAALGWARGISASDPRAVLKQIVLNNAVGVNHFERLHEYAGQQLKGQRFMRADLKAAVEAAVAELAAPAARVVYGAPFGSLQRSSAAPENADRQIVAAATTMERSLTLQAAVLGWLNLPAVAEMSREQLAHAARVTASVLDLEGWHARRNTRNYDWDALIGYLDRQAPELKDGPVQGAVEEVRRQVVARLREIEDGGAADSDAAAVPDGNLPEAEPEVFTAGEAAEVVQNWLTARIEENEIPDDRDAKRLVLRGILSNRTNGFAPHWKSLKGFEAWPDGLGPEVMLEGVRAVLAELGGERRPPSWAGVTPNPATAAPLAYARPRPTVDEQIMRQMKRKDAHIHELLVGNYQATGWLKSYLNSLDEPDESAVELVANLERIAAAVVADA